MKIIKKCINIALRETLFLFRKTMSQSTYTKLYTNILQKLGVDIADYNECGFIAPTVYFDGYNRSRIHIGRDVYLTNDVILLVHDQSIVTAYNSVNAIKNKGSMYLVKDIKIGNNVFIGMRSIILPGSTIGDNVIIGAGSIVKGVLEPNAVYAGCPAKKIGSTDEYYDKISKSKDIENK